MVRKLSHFTILGGAVLYVLACLQSPPCLINLLTMDSSYSIVLSLVKSTSLQILAASTFVKVISRWWSTSKGSMLQNTWSTGTVCYKIHKVLCVTKYMRYWYFDKLYEMHRFWKINCQCFEKNAFAGQTQWSLHVFEECK